MKKNTYTANYLANYSTSFAKNRTGSNKRALLKIVRDAAKEERMYNNSASFWVSDEDDKIVYDGRINESGQIWYAIRDYKEVY